MAKYPIGKQDFKAIREDGFVYVDKTRYIATLLENGTYYFLGRPRRFGKSLFLSTMEYFFRGERELFKGLYIDSYDWQWEQYPVIRIDLNGANYNEDESLNNKLKSVLKEHEENFGLNTDDNLNITERFRKVIIEAANKYKRKVIILVDEYEKPVIDLLHDSERMMNHRDILRGFYSVLKSSDAYLKLVFLTGVTKFGQMNVFSGLNNILDISMDDRYGAICGITEEELKTNFPEGIEGIARKYNKDFNGALSMLKENYDGYHFCENCPDIYNPYSLICALYSSKLRGYWSATGTPFILMQLLLKKHYNLEGLTDSTASEDRLMGTDNQFDDPLALFYQTGYLTVKKYDEANDNYRLGFPNMEVETAFFNYLLPSYSGQDREDSESFIYKLFNAFNEGKPEEAMGIMEEFTAGISYDVVPKVDVERHFQNLIYITCRLLASKRLNVKTEQKTSDGRIDMVIENDKFIYIIELKRDSSAETPLQQIIDTDYALQCRHDSREVFLIGANFSSSQKRINGFTVKRYNE